jgi:hypothetical protein
MIAVVIAVVLLLQHPDRCSSGIGLDIACNKAIGPIEVDLSMP